MSVAPSRRVALALGMAAALVATTAGSLYGRSARLIGRRYEVPVPRPLAHPLDRSAITRGEHLTRAVMNCVLCHGADLGGSVYDTSNAVAVVAGPNLTRGRGGIGARLTDADWVRALRYGVRRDGTSLVVMPSEVFAHVSDADLAAIVAYVRSLPPVDRVVPETRHRPLGRALLAMGKLNLLVASKAPRIAAPERIAAAQTAEYGAYLADIGGCRGCHGLGLSGGRVAGPPGLPPSSNLTPDPVTGLGRWRETDFVRAMRAGRRPDGSAVDAFMPWQVLGGMTDDELHAIWLYLRGLPARRFGNK